MESKRTFAKPTAILKGIAGYGIYVSFNLFFIIYALALYALTLPFPRTRRKIAAFSLRKTLSFMLLLLDLVGVAKFKSLGTENILAGRAAIYAANHRSLLDSIMMLSKIPNAGVVVKSSYMPLLAIGILVKLFDFVAIDKNSKDSLVKARDECRKLLSEGVSIIIFPEGTRSPSRRMLEFGSLAFRLAAETRTPLVPAAILQKGPLLTKCGNSFFPSEKDEFILSFLSPMQPEEFDSARTMQNRAHRSIVRELERLKTQ